MFSRYVRRLAGGQAGTGTGTGKYSSKYTTLATGEEDDDLMAHELGDV